MNKIKVKPEGRKDIWLPEKKSLKKFIKGRKLDNIHNIIVFENYVLGCDCNIKKVLKNIDNAERIAIFTDYTMNIGHSLALINNNELQILCYDIEEISESDLEVTNE